jgi:hypothetical protein
MTSVVSFLVTVGTWTGFIVLAIRWWTRIKADRCDVGGCHEPAVHVVFVRVGTPTWTTGFFRICAHHKEWVRRCVGAPTERVYDQELAPGTDLAQWDREVGS